MKHIFVNLKRFDVSRRFGGLCAVDSPKEWIEGVIAETIGQGLGCMNAISLTFLLPESLHPEWRDVFTVGPGEKPKLTL